MNFDHELVYTNNPNPVKSNTFYLETLIIHLSN